MLYKNWVLSHARKPFRNEIRSTGVRLECVSGYGSKCANLIVRIAASFVCLGYYTPSMTQTVTTMPVSERRFVADLISNGIHPINIRAKAIRDETLVSAIQQGARTRQIHVLLDENSPEIQALVRSKNLKIRLTLEDQRGKLGGNKLQGSFVMETSNGYYLTWNGPFVLTESAFGPVTRFHGESGEGPGETGSRDVRMFEHDFSSAVEIVLPKQEDDLMHERQIRYSRIVLICAVLVLLAVFVVLGNRVRIWMQQPR